MAVGIAVLTSMMLVPRGYVDGRLFWTSGEQIVEWAPYFVSTMGQMGHTFLPRTFTLQTVFLAVLFAVIANIRWRRRKAEKEKA
jgi:hypothetical protein